MLLINSAPLMAKNSFLALLYYSIIQFKLITRDTPSWLYSCFMCKCDKWHKKFLQTHLKPQLSRASCLNSAQWSKFYLHNSTVKGDINNLASDLFQQTSLFSQCSSHLMPCRPGAAQYTLSHIP